MQQIKELIYAVCICAVINSAIRLISPEKFVKEIRIICTLMLILCTAAKAAPGFKIDADSLLPAAEEKKFGDLVLEDTEKALEEKLLDRLVKEGIENVDVGIDCTLDEYNYVTAERVCITLAEEDEESKELVMKMAKELFPKAETEVDTYDSKAEKASFR